MKVLVLKSSHFYNLYLLLNQWKWMLMGLLSVSLHMANFTIKAMEYFCHVQYPLSDLLSITRWRKFNVQKSSYDT